MKQQFSLFCCCFVILILFGSYTSFALPCEYATSSNLDVSDATCQILCSQGRNADGFRANCILGYVAKSLDFTKAAEPLIETDLEQNKTNNIMQPTKNEVEESPIKEKGRKSPYPAKEKDAKNKISFSTNPIDDYGKTFIFGLEPVVGLTNRLHFDGMESTEAQKETDAEELSILGTQLTNEITTITTTTKIEDEEDEDDDDEERMNPPPQRLTTTSTVIPSTGSTSGEKSSNIGTIVAVSVGAAAAIGLAGAAYKFGGATIRALSSTPDAPCFDVDVEIGSPITDVDQRICVSQSFFA